MKRSNVVRMLRTIAERAPSMRRHGRYVALQPVHWTLRGLYLDGSVIPESVYACVFVMPLYVRADTIVFNLGDRLGGGTRTWKPEEAGALAELFASEGMPFLERVAEPAALADWIACIDSPNFHARFARAASLTVARRSEEAVSCLRELARDLKESFKGSGVRWQAMLLEDVVKLDSAITAGSADRLLEKWSSFTRTSLKLPDSWATEKSGGILTT